MANFVALTPPLGQQAWGPPPAANAFQVTLPANYSIADIGYPVLDSFIRTVILSKNPGIIFQAPEDQEVFPFPDPDPAHIQLIWDKYDETLVNPVANRLVAVVERELEVALSEFPSDSSITIIRMGSQLVPVCSQLSPVESHSFCIGALMSKKRNRRISSDPTYDNMGPPTKSRKTMKSLPALESIPSLKAYYDAAFTPDSIVDHQMPSYIMAKNYVDQYSQSNEKFAERVREIIFDNGAEKLTQRLARFFAWGLNQPIQTTPAAAASTVGQPATQILDTASSSHDAPTAAVAESSSDAQNTTVATIDAPISTPQSETDSEGPATPECNAIMEDILDTDLAETYNSSSDEEIINVIPMRTKPTFKFEPSALSSLLPGFVQELKVANEELVRNGAGSELEVSEEFEGEHIEMNLGLGVLEEVASDSDDEKVTMAPAGIQELE